MTKEELDAIKKRYANAHIGHAQFVWREIQGRVLVGKANEEDPDAAIVGEFLKEDVPSLIKEVRRLQAQVAELEARPRVLVADHIDVVNM